MALAQEMFIVIWISAVVGAVLSHYLTPKNIFKITKVNFINVVWTALVMGLGILIVVVIGLTLFKFI